MAIDDMLNSGNMEDDDIVGSLADFPEFDESSKRGFKSDSKLDFLKDLQLNVYIELGRTKMQIKDILELERGYVIELEKLASEPVDVFINNKKIAEGEVVVIDKHFGIRITNLIATEERLKGYRSALYENGLELNPKLEIPGDFNEESGYTAMKKILNLKPRPTAVFASNDAMAIGAVSAIQSKGLKIPEDIAIGGFDDIPIAKYLKPSLSSVHVPINNLGTNAAIKLFKMIKNENNLSDGKTVLPATLVVRESCGCL